MPSRVTVVLELAGLILLVAACPQESKRAPAVPDAAKKVAPAPPGPTELALAMDGVLKLCDIDKTGALSGCREGADGKLTAAEQAAGRAAALLGYCRAMSHDNPYIHNLAASRIGRLTGHRELREQASPELLTCLVGALPGAMSKAVWQAGILARAATYLSTALGQEEAVLKLLKPDSPRMVTVAVYESLWVNGRLRVLQRMRRLLDEERAADLRVAVIRGFAYDRQLAANETKAVCAFLKPLLGDRESAVAGAAVARAAVACPDLRDEALAAVQAGLKRKALTLDHVGALNAIRAGSSSPAQKKLCAALLKTLATRAALPELVRQEARRVLSGK